MLASRSLPDANGRFRDDRAKRYLAGKRGRVRGRLRFGAHGYSIGCAALVLYP
jgi:hypothetical protein